MEIKAICVNCEHSMAYDHGSSCEYCYDLQSNKRKHFVPRSDLVELHRLLEETQGKLRKALDALTRIKKSNVGCAVLWDTKDTDGSWYSVHTDDYIDEVLEDIK